MSKARILLLDIETAPSLGWVWGKYEQDVIDFDKDWYLLSFAYKWLGQRAVYTRGLDNFPGYAKDRENDELLVRELWRLMNHADVIIAHNGDQFDIRKANTRFLTHGLPPPSPYRTVDTLKLARRTFRFDSNKLDDLGRYLGIGRKLPHTGFHLWRGAMQGDAQAWRLLKRYNKQDVRLLERVYLALRAWSTNHPNVTQGAWACPKCGSPALIAQGYAYTQGGARKQKWQCKNCSGWFYGTVRNR